MIINGSALLDLTPIKNMENQKKQAHGTSHGLAEAGYDLRIKQSVRFGPQKDSHHCLITIQDPEGGTQFKTGRFVLASAIEEFDMPSCLVGVVHDKSTWARKGLSVFNTVIEPGWKGFLTLELVFHGSENLIIPAGAGIAQVLFHSIEQDAEYNGKYQHQINAPVEAIMNKDQQ